MCPNLPQNDLHVPRRRASPQNCQFWMICLFGNRMSLLGFSSDYFLLNAFGSPQRTSLLRSTQYYSSTRRGEEQICCRNVTALFIRLLRTFIGPNLADPALLHLSQQHSKQVDFVNRQQISHFDCSQISTSSPLQSSPHGLSRTLR